MLEHIDLKLCWHGRACDWSVRCKDVGGVGKRLTELGGSFALCSGLKWSRQDGRLSYCLRKTSVRSSVIPIGVHCSSAFTGVSVVIIYLS